MRYIDSGTRNPSQALGIWLLDNANDSVREARWQAGYFGLDGIGVLAPVLARFAETNGFVRGVLGGNQGATLADDVRELIALIGLPRSGAALGVVSYAGSLFHPKVYHFVREDGSAAAYVGSANLTWPAMASTNVEAGILLDTRDGDPASVLAEIASAVDAWFNEDRGGFSAISVEADVDQLVAEGILGLTPVVPIVPPEGHGSRPPGSAERFRLKALIGVPRYVRVLHAKSARETAIPQSAAVAVPPPNYPQYILFAPNVSTPTIDEAALSGAALPSGAAGLIIRFNRDSGRHLEGRTGTANISLPIATLVSLRFGLSGGRYRRPRAEFQLRMRYVSDEKTLEASPVSTNVMGYGYAADESGHQDVRMLVPAAIRDFRDKIGEAGLVAPSVGDVALLEWPTKERPEFRLTLLQPGCNLAVAAEAYFSSADHAHTLVSPGACWLPGGFSPAW